MDLAFITPTTFLERYSTQGDIYLALAHLVDDKGENKYARFHRREASKGRRVILDNGLFEGAQVSTEALLRRAEAISASVVCAPDILYDSESTIKQFKQFIKAKQDYGLVADVMGIPQADNQSDWWDCFRFLELSKDCQLIGLSILSIPRAFKEFATESTPITSSRMHVIRQLRNYQSLLGRRIKYCHLLGLGESYADITLAKRYLSDTVLSNDSSSCFVHGANKVRYDRFGQIPGGKIKTKLNFSMDEVNGTEVDIQHNIDIAKQISRRVYL